MATQTFTSSGTFSVPAGVAVLQCQAWGEGGAGDNGISSTSSGAGAGGGEYAAELTLGVTPGGTLTVTIGTGGTATDTTVTGGSVTVTAHAGADGGGGIGGPGGSGSANSVAFAGGTGGTGASGSNIYGGGGGSSAGTSAGGGTGGAGGGSPGSGGTAPSGGAAGGSGGGVGGAAGTAPGGGGGGGGDRFGGSGAGGAGAAGQVILTWTVVPVTGVPGYPVIPPGPFSPMSYRFRQPPTAPFITGTGRAALQPLAAAGTNELPAGAGAAALRPLAAAGAGSVHTFFPSSPLPVKAELLVNGTWTDISSFIQGDTSQVVITRGRPDETQSITPAQCTLRLLNPDGRFSPSNPAGAYAPYLGRNTQLRVSVDAWVDVAGTPLEYSGFRFWGEIAAFKPGWDESGNYRYADITAAGPVRRYSQGSATIGSALRRYYTRLTGTLAPYGYWPAEDIAGATQFASYVAGVPAMGFTGSPSLGSDSAFGGSDPLPAVNGSSWHGQTGAASSPPGSGSITQATPGTYRFTCPPGVTAITGVDVVGGGGGGGAAGPHAGGGGGGGAGQSAAGSIGVTAGVTYTYAVGAGGTAGTSVGAGGGAGGASSWTGDTQACTAGGGQGGQGGDTSAGGTGGTGTEAGGTGGTGQSSITTSGQLYFSANTGATGGASGGTAGQVGFTWTSPAGITSIQAAVGGGAGGGAGGGQASNGTGGGGGGGGGLTTAAVNVAPLTAYTFLAGNGGNGGNSAASGETGGDSVITGDPSGPDFISITAAGGTGGSGGTGGAGGAGDGAGRGGASGSAGGNGAPSLTGHGEGGGGGGGGGGGDNGTGGNATSTRDPGAGGGNGSGGGWGAVSNGGGGQTSGGTGQSGAILGSGAGGGGGGGAFNLTSGNPGGGGGAGWAYWSWSVTAPAGGGGGSSGGTSAPGGAGGNDGTGGTPPSGGGRGGYQGGTGILGPALGGGGGGGIPASGTSTAAAAVSGAPGQVSFSWSGGAVSPVAADIVRFPLQVDAAGGTDGTVLARIVTFGTVARMDLTYRTASGGSLELAGYNSGGTQLFDSGTVLSGLNGVPVMADIELTQNGTGGATWSLAAIEPGAGSALGTFTGTVASVTVSNVSDVYISPDSDVTFASAGHIAVQTYADPLTVLATVMAGYAGELAEARLARLCAEEGLAFTLAGPSGVTPQMQAQQDDTFPNVIQSCEDADRGLLFESRDSFGLTYRSRVSMQGQAPALTMDYSQAQVAFPVQPAADDQYTRNDIQLTRSNGSSATVAQATGPMSVQAPPNGVGDYLYTLTAYVYQDSQLPNMAAWMLITGTVADERFPVISADMSRPEIVPLFAEAAGIDMGDYLQIVNPPSWLTSMPVQQLAWGVAETLSNFTWRIDFNAVPESPYSTGNPPSW